MKIGIIGSKGRMGQLITSFISQHHHLILGPGYYRSCSLTLLEIFAQNDAVIDFSHNALTLAVLEACLHQPKPLVIGTTGWGDDPVISAALKKAGDKTRIVWAANTSLGSVVQANLVGELVRLLGPNFTIDVREQHHRHKVDAPSGTARLLIQTAQQAAYHYHEEKLEEEDMTQALRYGSRSPNLIGVHVERRGQIPGEHSVVFTSDDESLTITHTVFNRDVFAAGAVKAVSWLLTTANLANGIYTMAQVLGLKNS